LYDSTCPGHFGVSSHFIDEDEPSDIKTGLIGFPILARLSDIGPSCPAARSVLFDADPMARIASASLSTVISVKPSAP